MLTRNTFLRWISRLQQPRCLTPFLLAWLLGIFLLDAQTPLGITVWLGYLVAILLTRPLPAWAVLLTTGTCEGLLFLGWAVSPLGVPSQIGLVNRALGAGLLMLTAVIILQRQASAAALARAGQRARATLDGALDGVVTADREGRIVYWNPAAADVFGWTSDEIQGRRLETLIPPQYRETHASGFRRFQQTGTGPIFNRRLELAGLRKDGQEFPLELTVVRVQGDGGMECTAFVRDLTQRKAAEKQLEEWAHTLEHRVEERTAELRAANAQLQEIDRVRSAFVNIVSHEMRTPLSASLGYVENMLAEIVGPLTDGQARYLSRVQDNIRRLARLINDLLDLALAEQGRLRLHLTDVIVNEVIDDAIEILRPFAESKSITIEVSRTSSLLVVKADRDKLLQAFLNVVHNALKFTGSGGAVSISAAQAPPCELRLQVQDNGPGLAAEVIPKVFDDFYTEGAVSGTTKGIGLGLAITKRLVELHGGRVEVDSTIGQGTSFIIVLPLIQSVQNPCSKAEGSG